MTFDIGAKVVHPAYGPGQVVAMKDQPSADAVKRYYVIRIPAKRLMVMVPTEQAESIGLRPVSDGQTLDRVWRILRGDGRDLDVDWKERKQRVQNNLKTGDILEIARDLRDLVWQRRERNLSYTDRKLLEETENTLAGELALAKDIELEEALKRVRSRLRETES